MLIANEFSLTVWSAC